MSRLQEMSGLGGLEGGACASTCRPGPEIARHGAIRGPRYSIPFRINMHDLTDHTATSARARAPRVISQPPPAQDDCAVPRLLMALGGRAADFHPQIRSDTVVLTPHGTFLHTRGCWAIHAHRGTTHRYVHIHHARRCSSPRPLLLVHANHGALLWSPRDGADVWDVVRSSNGGMRDACRHDL